MKQASAFSKTRSLFSYQHSTGNLRRREKRRNETCRHNRQQQKNLIRVCRPPSFGNQDTPSKQIKPHALYFSIGQFPFLRTVMKTRASQQPLKPWKGLTKQIDRSNFFSHGSLLRAYLSLSLRPGTPLSKFDEAECTAPKLDARSKTQGKPSPPL